MLNETNCKPGFKADFLQRAFDEERTYISILVLKIASRCNLKCTYCHWFRDEKVYNQARFMKIDVFDNVIEKLNQHLQTHRTPQLRVIFHGGEPLLIKKSIFESMCLKLRKLGQDTNTKLKLCLTTNGVLLDDEWAKLLYKYNVGVSVSIDADEKTHDRYRITNKNNPSYQSSVRGIKLLQKVQLPKISILGVLAPNIEPTVYCDHYIEELKVKHFDILIPNNNHGDVENNSTFSISDFYIKLFDIWRTRYWKDGIRIRIVEAFIKATLGIRTKYPGIGICASKVISINPDGDIEPDDVLRINGNNHVNTNLNIKKNSLDEVFLNPYWLDVLKKSLTIPSPCIKCNFKGTCRGGKLVHRYSLHNGYDNCSIYCEDLKKIYTHIKLHIQDLLDKKIIKSDSIC